MDMDCDIYILGSILIWPVPWVPRGWALCDGHLLQVSQNAALFSLIGTQYGGDGRNTFAVPDLRGQVIVGAGVSASGRNYPMAVKGGRESVDIILNANQLPAHTHPATLSGTVDVPKLQASANLAGNTYAPSATNKYLAASPAGPAGGQIWSNTLTGAVDVGGLTGANFAGATVNVGNNTTQGAKINVPTQPPFLTLNFIIATRGTYPPRE